jgi:hypothetical protein
VKAVESKYVLMHKNTEVAEVFINEMIGGISKIGDVINADHLPPGTAKKGNSDHRALNEWWTGRSIPASRSGLKNALDNLGISNARLLLTKSYGLSLSDHYWIKPAGTSLTWDDMNFFENDFSEDIGNILFGGVVSENMSFISPDNTSDGWLKKRWKISDGKRILLKAGSDPFEQEPFNEVIASALMKRLNVPHVSYEIVWIDDSPYSVCENFLSTETELVSAHRIMQITPKPNHQNSYEHFLNCCVIAGMKKSDVIAFIDRMLTVDYIIANQDRHFNNLGFIRNAETLEYISPAPVYDSGTSLFYNKPVKRIENYESKPFRTDPEEQLKLVTSFDWFDASKLNGFTDEVGEILYPLMETGFIDYARIKKIEDIIAARIDHIAELAAG